MSWLQTHTAKGRLRARRVESAGFSLAFAARGATLTGEPFNPTFVGTDGIASEPNRSAHRCSNFLCRSRGIMLIIPNSAGHDPGPVTDLNAHRLLKVLNGAVRNQRQASTQWCRSPGNMDSLRRPDLCRASSVARETARGRASVPRSPRMSATSRFCSFVSPGALAAKM